MSEIIFTMGLPAAGKSYTADKMFGATHTTIDPDAIKSSHPDYDPTNPAALHAWSQEVCERLWMEALASGCGDWLMDGTGTNSDKMVRRINQAKAHGFTTKLVYVTCSLAKSLKRNSERERVVPEHVIKSKALDIATSFEIVSQYVDSVQVVDNNAW